MALITVNLTDTFDEWRIKSNTLGTNQGDLATLSTTAKGSIVAAINEVFLNDSDDMENVVDDLTPELGGDLDVLTRSIVSSSNRNIAITPHGTGNVVITKGDYTGSLNTLTTAVTQSASNNTTKVATTAYVDAQVATEDTIAEMNDTTISGSANLDLLQYNSGTSKWVNTAIGTVVGATQAVGNNTTLLATTAFVTAAVQLEDTLAEMNDTTISGLANLDVLQYTGSVWENKTISGAGIPTLGFTIAMAVALG
jgi:hypothetical protein